MSDTRPTESISVAATADDLQSARRNWLGVFALFVAAVLLALMASSAVGQAPPRYEVKKVDPKFDTEAAAKQMSREAASYAMASDLSKVAPRRANAAQIYFSQYVPAKITQPKSVHQISDLMNDANALLGRAIRSRRPSSGNILRWMYGGLKPIAVGNYQPVARINAIQFISKLAKPAPQSGMPPIPYPFVIDDLMPIFMDANAPEGVRAAALHGIERFVRYTPADQVKDAVKTSLTTEMKKMMDEAAPEGRDPLVHAYLQRYAVSILTNLGSEPTLGTQLVSVSTDEAKPDLIALHSAATLGRMKANLKADEVETEKVLKQWTNRVLKAFESEITRLDTIEGKVSVSGVTQPSDPGAFLDADVSEEDGKATTSAAGMEDMMGMGGMEMGGMEMGGMEMGMGDDMEMGMGMMGMGMSGPGGLGAAGAVAKVAQPAEVVASRKKLNYTIQSLWLGVTGTSKPPEEAEDIETLTAKGGIMAATPDEKLSAVRKWLTTINEVATVLNDPSVGQTNTYAKNLSTQVELLENYLAGKDDEIKPNGDIPTFDDPLSSFTP